MDLWRHLHRGTRAERCAAPGWGVTTPTPKPSPSVGDPQPNDLRQCLLGALPAGRRLGPNSDVSLPLAARTRANPRTLAAVPGASAPVPSSAFSGANEMLAPSSQVYTLCNGQPALVTGVSGRVTLSRTKGVVRRGGPGADKAVRDSSVYFYLIRHYQPACSSAGAPIPPLP
jgi:hypothetical protein